MSGAVPGADDLLVQFVYRDTGEAEVQATQERLRRGYDRIGAAADDASATSGGALGRMRDGLGMVVGGITAANQGMELLNKVVRGASFVLELGRAGAAAAGAEGNFDDMAEAGGRLRSSIERITAEVLVSTGVVDGLSLTADALRASLEGASEATGSFVDWLDEGLTDVVEWGAGLAGINAEALGAVGPVDALTDAVIRFRQEAERKAGEKIGDEIGYYAKKAREATAALEAGQGDPELAAAFLAGDAGAQQLSGTLREINGRLDTLRRNETATAGQLSALNATANVSWEAFSATAGAIRDTEERLGATRAEIDKLEDSAAKGGSVLVAYGEGAADTKDRVRELKEEMTDWSRVWQQINIEADVALGTRLDEIPERLKSKLGAMTAVFGRAEAEAERRTEAIWRRADMRRKAYEKSQEEAKEKEKEMLELEEKQAKHRADSIDSMAGSIIGTITAQADLGLASALLSEYRAITEGAMALIHGDFWGAAAAATTVAAAVAEQALARSLGAKGGGSSSGGSSSGGAAAPTTQAPRSELEARQSGSRDSNATIIFEVNGRELGRASADGMNAGERYGVRLSSDVVAPSSRRWLE